MLTIPTTLPPDFILPYHRKLLSRAWPKIPRYYSYNCRAPFLCPPSSNIHNATSPTHLDSVASSYIVSRTINRLYFRHLYDPPPLLNVWRLAFSVLGLYRHQSSVSVFGDRPTDFACLRDGEGWLSGSGRGLGCWIRWLTHLIRVREGGIVSRYRSLGCGNRRG